jgi:hypothetical protein
VENLRDSVAVAIHTLKEILDICIEKFHQRAEDSSLMMSSKRCDNLLFISKKLWRHFLFFFFIHIHIHYLGHFPPSPLSSSQVVFCLYHWFCWRKETSLIRETKCFCYLSWGYLYRNIPSIAFMYTCYDPCWFISNLSLHWFLIPFSW